MNAELKTKYLEMLTDRVNELSYIDIDAFCEDEDVSEDEVDELLALRFIVTEDRA